MSVKVTCPGCNSSLKVNSSARGKKVRCPTEGCGRILTVPDLAENESPLPKATASPAAPAVDDDTVETFRLAAPQTDAEAVATAPAAPKKDRFASIPMGRAADQEVLLPDGRIKAMTMRDIRDAILQGKLNRFSLMRTVRDDDVSSRQRLTDEKAWQPIGYSVFIEPEKEKKHYTKAARQGMSYRDDVALIAGIVLFALIMIGFGVWLYYFQWELTPHHFAWIAASAVAIGMFQVAIRIGAPRNFFLVLAMLSGVTYLVVRNLPEMSLFLLKSGALVCGGLVVVPLARGLGVVSGIAFDYAYRAMHHDPNDTGPAKQPQQRAPSDGYP